MSVTSATETFTDGAQLYNQEKYDSKVSISIEDPIVLEKDDFEKPLAQRFITLYSDNPVYAEYRLDDVAIRCPSDAFREYQRSQWSVRKAEAEHQSWVWTVTTIGSGLVAALGGILMAMGSLEVAKIVGTTIASTPLAPVLLVAGGVFAVVSLLLAANASQHVDQANDQIKKWDVNPLAKIYHERNRALEEGFPYIFDHQLKLGSKPSTTARLHPKQVEHEYKKYVDIFCDLLLNKLFHTSKIDWMIAFRSLNPFITNLMVYGLGAIPDHMKIVIEDYARFESFLHSIEKTYNDLKDEEIAHANERITGLKKMQAELLQPHIEVRDHSIKTAREEKDRAIVKARKERETFSAKASLPEDPKPYEASARFRKAKEAAENAYALNTDPINKKYGAKILEVENELMDRLRKLEEQKGQQMANNCNAARELLIRAKQAWDNKGYQPVNFQQYFPYQAPVMGWQQQQPVYTPPTAPPQAPAYFPPQPVLQQPPMIYAQPGYGQPPDLVHPMGYIHP